MRVTAAGYRALADICLHDAETAALEQVRARCLRSAAALTAMAEGVERMCAARAARVPEADPLGFSQVDDGAR